ncbi:DnaA N-terminal domain-containing protein [Tardiphaga sp. 813_E8_N1_3]|uniref:DnaA N-terminal domain-containing protein n=1 Tax=Tardiphaga sp. 813_E8_N1_3 TaxID=3240760 RepID=UPI003F251E80
MTGGMSMDRLSRLADTLQKVDDADVRFLAKLIDGVVQVIGDAARSSTSAQSHTDAAVARPNPFDRADIDPMLAAVVKRLRKRLSDEVCRAWIAKLDLVGEQADVVTLAAPNRFIADHVNAQFGLTLLDAWQAEKPTVMRVVVRPAHHDRGGRCTPPK